VQILILKYKNKFQKKPYICVFKINIITLTMKQIFTFCLLVGTMLGANAQISVTPGSPYTQDFEGAFTNGTRIDFLPNWFGNQVQPTAGAPRIHRDTLYPHAGAACLAALPTATVKDTIIVTYDIGTAASFATLNFWAASDSAKTATGSRSAVVYHDYSLDGGILYSTPTIVGDSLRFPRNVTPYQQYSINILGSGIIKSRFVVSRGAGIGTAARFLMDDFRIEAGVESVDKQQIDAHSLRIVPNPNNGVFSLNLENTNVQTADITVFDVLGKQVFTQKNIDVNAWQMPNRLERGVYNIVLTSENQVFTQRIVVQ
jgi:Secretion system C-terminal sorting domain